MLAGIDISKYQTSTPSLAGLSFVVLRASIALTKDSLYDTHYANARKAGVVVMAYHFGYSADQAPIAGQVEAFLAAATDADFLWLDQEEQGFTDAQAQEFVDAVRAAGRPCGLYHSASGFGGVNADAKWVADWRPAAVAAGHPLSADGTREFPKWDLWQWQGSPLDRDYANPDRPLAGLLRLGYVTQRAYETLGALKQAEIDNLEADIAIRDAELIALQGDVLRLQADLAAAPDIERERIAQAEATRIRGI
jgi:glycosyl hydrolase family 25